MNKEAIKLIFEIFAIADNDEPDDGQGSFPRIKKLADQALALLAEQPNCEGCPFFKHTHSNEHCYRYTEEPSLCKLRQPIEQPPAEESNSDFIDGARCLLRQGVNDDQWTFATLLRKTLDRLDHSEARLKAMYVGDLSPESRLSGYKVIVAELKKEQIK